MGFDEILLSGVDYCYDRNGTNSRRWTKVNIDEANAPTVETYKGKIAFTDKNLQMGVKYLAEIAEPYTGKVFNLNNNAARVAGIDFKSNPDISGAKWQLPEIDKATIKQQLDHLNMVKKELAKARASYNEILKLSKDAIRFNDSLHGKKGIKQDFKSQQKLDKIEQKLNSKYKSYTSLAQLVASREFLRLLNQDSNNRTPEHEHRWLDNYYNAYLKGTQVVLDAINDAKRVIELRLQENKIHLNINALLDYWSTYQVLEEAVSC